MSNRDCPGCGRPGTPQQSDGVEAIYQCEYIGCRRVDAWRVVEDNKLPAGVDGPDVPADGSCVDVVMEECPSCDYGPTAGKAWLIREGPHAGEACVRCEVCYCTHLGEPEVGRARDITARGVAGATNMILDAISKIGQAENLKDVYVRVTVALAKIEIHETIAVEHPRAEIKTYAELLRLYPAADGFGFQNEPSYKKAWGLQIGQRFDARSEIRDELDAWLRAGRPKES